MGTWGPGNFENDHAADILGDLIRPMLYQIESTVASDTLMEPDEPDSVWMMCNLEFLAAILESLERQLDLSHPVSAFRYDDIIPSKETIATWKEKYLPVWDRYIDQLGPSEEFKQQRRQVIVNTFDRVIRLAKDE